MSIKCLYHFQSLNQFNQFTEQIVCTKWRIEKQLLKERADYYSDMTLFNEMKDLFLEKDISIWPLKPEEIITWFDTMTIMRRISLEMFISGITIEGINIIIEYPLVFGNHMRTDYLVVYHRLIVVLEFGMFNQDERRSEERYSKKLQDSISHRQILANMIHPNIDVVNYVIIYKPEYDRTRGCNLLDNIEYNKRETNRLKIFLVSKINEQNTFSAINQLNILSKL